jgi:hypothetical protein
MRSATPTSTDASATPSFALQPDTTGSERNADIVGTVWLKFAHPVVEEDFLRFIMRGRNVHLLICIGVIATYDVGRMLLAPTNYLIAFHAAQFVIAAAALALFAVVVVLPARGARALSVLADLGLAQRAEAVSYLFVNVAGFIACIGIPYESVVGCQVDHGADDDRCHYFSISVPVGIMVMATLWFRPRVNKSVVCCGIAAAGFFVGQVAVDVYSAFDYAAAVLLLLTALVVVTIEAVGSERRQRRHFVNHVRMIRAEEKLAAMMAHTKDILRSAMPPELLNDDMTLAATTHRSDCATVGMSDIYDFAQWSCGLLVEDVVLNLHMLLTMCDVGAIEHGVVRAMTYGDCYVVCANLIVVSDGHAQAVSQFEEWLITACTETWDGTGAPLAIRASVCTGPLAGQIAGEASLRYVVSGAALDAARAAVAEAGPSCVVAAVLDVEPSRAIAVTSPKAGETAKPTAEISVVKPWSPDEDNSGASAGLEFSSLWLTFDAPATREEFALFIAETEVAVARFAAVTPPCVFGAYVLVMLLEMASSDPRRHHVGGSPMWGLVVATVIGLLVLGLRLAAAPVHVAALYAATALSLATGMVSLIFTECVFAQPHWHVGLLLGVPGIFLRLPWLAQTALQFTTVLVPIAVYITQYYPHRYRVVYWNFIAGGFTLCAFVAARYFYSRALCLQYVAARGAAVAVRAAASKADHQERLLLGLLPPHTVPHANANALQTLGEPNYVENWSGLSALQLSVRAWRSQRGLPAMTEVWRCVAAALDDGAGDLEMAQSTGDTFLVAGPFVKRGAATVAEHDGTTLRAARRAVVLVRELARALHGVCSFTAVLTSGSGCGALLGASLLSFRLLGPMVRQSNALLAAAPHTVAKSVAFASAEFCQQHQNFVAPTRDADAGMSMALHPSAASESDAADSLVASPTTAAADVARHDATTFGEGARWRVRGVGVAVVHQIVLQELPAPVFAGTM